MNKLIFVLGAIAMTGLVLYSLNKTESNSFGQKEFDEFLVKYEKSYGSANEHNYRFSIFKQNLKKVQNHNEKPNKSYKLGINKFSDLTFTEFSSKYLQTPRAPSKRVTLGTVDKSLPTEVDWRQQEGAVGAVKNQEQCGSCWAFSTIASLENAVWRNSKKVVNLSEQELVDCAGGKYGNYGCNGGLMDHAYDYIIDNKVATESAYPYRAVDQRCSRKKKKKEEELVPKATTIFLQVMSVDFKKLQQKVLLLFLLKYKVISKCTNLVFMKAKMNTVDIN